LTTKAAVDAGRPGITAVVTDDPDAARDRSATEQGIYGSLPAYRHMMEAEGVGGPADLVIAGSEDHVAEDCGATPPQVRPTYGSRSLRATDPGADEAVTRQPCTGAHPGGKLPATTGTGCDCMDRGAH
jgi:hypothetical protein